MSKTKAKSTKASKAAPAATTKSVTSKAVKARPVKVKCQDDLTLKEKRWLEIYLQTGNATEAARRAYNCTEESARAIGHRKVTKVHIQERVAERVAEAGTTTNEVVGTLVSQMRIDATEAFEPGESTVVDRLRDKGLGHWVRAITIKRYMERIGEESIPVETMRLEFHNSQTASAQLCKVLGIEKLPGANPADDKARVEAAIKTWQEATGGTREDAIHYLAPQIPQVKELGKIG